jgi:hypothetical protein
MRWDDAVKFGGLSGEDRADWRLLPATQAFLASVEDDLRHAETELVSLFVDGNATNIEAPFKAGGRVSALRAVLRLAMKESK